MVKLWSSSVARGWLEHSAAKVRLRSFDCIRQPMRASPGRHLYWPGYESLAASLRVCPACKELYVLFTGQKSSAHLCLGFC